MHGEGTFTWIDGETYTGKWSNNLRDGEGKLTRKGGEEVVMVFNNGIKQDGQ